MGMISPPPIDPDIASPVRFAALTDVERREAIDRDHRRMMAHVRRANRLAAAGSLAVGGLIIIVALLVARMS